MNIDYIPNFFNLAGHQITVKEDRCMSYERDLEGLASYIDNTIYLANNDQKYREYPESNKKVTFLHELVHFILNIMGRDALNSDEAFVNLFAELLYQAMSTAVCLRRDNVTEKDVF